MVNIIFLKTFASLAKTKSLRAAAHLNFITQSAVSQQVRVLENKLNTKLIERNNKGVELTHDGQIFLRYAETIIHEYENAVVEIHNNSNAFTGTIKIATIYSIGLYQLQPLIRAFLKKYPQIHIFLEYYHNDLIYEKVMNHSIDFGFVAFPRKTPNLSYSIFNEEEMILVQSTQRPTLKRKQMDCRDLNQCRFVTLSHTTPTGKEINQLLKKLSVNLNVIHEFENVETLKSAVVIGMGCALIPKQVVTAELKNKTLEEIHLNNFRFHRPLGILKSKLRSITKSKQKFYEMFSGK